MPNSLRLFSYTAPTEIRCAVAAPNRTSAAKLLGTTAETLKVRGKEHERADHAPDEDIAGLQLAEANPQKVFIKKNGEWEELPEKNCTCFCPSASSRPRAIRTVRSWMRP